MTSPEALDLAIDASVVRRAFARYPSGIVAIAASLDGVEAVMVASSFTVGVSAEPPLVSVAVQRISASWPHLRSSRTIGISVFADDQAALVRQMGGPNRANRLAGIRLVSSGSDARFLEGSSAWFECVVRNEFDAGDHRIVLLEVIALRIHPDRLPLVFHNSGFRRMS